MPRLISADDLGARRTAQPQRGTVGFEGGAVARATEGLGGAIASIGEQMARQDDDQAVFEARRKLDAWERDNIYDPQKGAINKLGKDAFDLYKTVPADYDKFSGEVASTLTTARQRRVFQELSQSRRNQVADWAGRHALQQRNVYEQGQFEADMQSTRDRAALFADDPTRVATEMAIGRERAIGYLRGKGRSEEEINQVLRENAEKTHFGVLETLLAGDNWKAAKSYLDKNAEQMNPAAVLRISNQVQKQEDATEGAAAAHNVMGSLRRDFQPTDWDRVVNITMTSESGGQRFGKDGQLLTSPKGAQGEMQVMPKTAKDPGFGVKPAQNDSPDELARVGRDFLKAMVKRYGGDMQKAWAAYNAGPGQVDQAMATAKDQNDPEWQIFLPQETQQYMAKNMQALDAGGGTPARPTLQQTHDLVRQQLAGQRPERLRVALDESTRLYKEQTDAIKQREEESVAAAMQGMLENGGSWNALSPTIRNAVPPGKVDELLNFGARVAKGEDRTDPVVYQKMATDDGWLKGLSDAGFFAYRKKLSESDFQQMALRRGNLLNPKGASNQPGDVDFASMNSALNVRLSQMGIDPTPSARDKEGQQRVGAIRQSLTTFILQQQQQAGKKFNDAEMTKVIDMAFARQVPYRMVGFFGGETNGSDRLMSMQVSDIPPSVVERLKADFKSNGVHNPTNGDLLGAYLNLKLR